MISGFKEKSPSPSKIVGPSTQSAGTVLSMFLGVGPGVAIVAALTALIVLPLLRAFIPPASLWRCILRCCIPGHGLQFRSSCHLRSPR
jgi:hypothetical protein